ncbi:PREDICTED: beta-1,4-N-acetylgalactosaminyltransferase bre-4-like [Papilio xuthus]|uniref:Beta-1,4-N-acetylgalactosaminyltransferase n=1 Tax=Papilio xuthus TaxID=66420 RepID=A0AAJ6ZI55_PAPXU|nr:PREDICTED: beta-1,4-N-acetylgalactosaminyltransferase bre-4-like [Papilio xuthus]
MRYASKKKIFYLVFFTAVLLLLLQPAMKTRRSYEIIEKQNIISSLHEETAENYTSTAIVDCDYHDIIYDETTLPATVIDGDLNEGYRIKEGGEYAPPECKALFSSAIIVPYRDRAEQLRSFLVYMHSFLRRQHVHYRIYIVEQLDSQPFNRAKLINIGAIAAMNAGYPCLILHDVDLLPLKPANIYACTKYPRHMSGSYNKFRYILPYLNLIGGATSITAKQFKNINGMSNKYFGVRGDDDFLSRIESLMLKICQFEPQISEYYNIPNGHQGSWYTKNQKIFTKKGISNDGLNSLKYTEVATVLHPLFTHIMVDL